MSEGLNNPIERFASSFLELAAGIGAIALGLHFFNKAKDSSKKPNPNSKS